MLPSPIVATPSSTSAATAGPLLLLLLLFLSAKGRGCGAKRQWSFLGGGRRRALGRREGVHGFGFWRRVLLLGSPRPCGFGVRAAASRAGLLLRRLRRHLADRDVIIRIVILRLRRLRLQLADRDVVVVAAVLVIIGRRRRRVALGLLVLCLPSCHARAAAAASSHRRVSVRARAARSRCRAAGKCEQSRSPRDGF